MRPFLARLRGLSLASFPFWNKQCNQVLKIIVPFLPNLYFTGPSILRRAEVSSWGPGEKERRGAGEWRLVLANELTRWRAGVTGLFWLWRKRRSSERKWFCACVSFYI